MQQPRISCLLPVYNGEAFLEEAIGSILAQTFRDFELVVVDDGSRDSTPDILARLAATDPRIKVIRQENGGIVAALNTGLKACRGEYVARMDADDIALPHRFQFQADYLDSHPGCVLVGGVARSVSSDGKDVSRTTGGRHRRTDLSCFPPKIAVSMHPLITARREALIAVGGYRSDFPHAEDYDLFIRLSKLGGIDNPDEEVLIYRRHEGAISLKHLETQERSAAMSEIAAMEPGSEGFPARLVEPYVRLRIWRRYLSADRAKADHLLPHLIGDALNLKPETLLSPRYFGLRVRIGGAIAAAALRQARRSKAPDAAPATQGAAG
ncbi:glycosyltransferase family 2 protein [Phenylobacterium koreense]|uniref:Glycosyltransferase involved in cell wall biosynthesis n=1 Tax=Phenylobacterium koreense TaxID=266125 RepID=A0ABV2EQH7_9CAUL